MRWTSRRSQSMESSTRDFENIIENSADAVNCIEYFKEAYKI